MFQLAKRFKYLQQQSYTTACGKKVLIQRKAFLKKLTLRFCKKSKAFVVSAPFFHSLSSITEFIDGAGTWFAKVDLYHQQNQRHPIAAGQTISILGKQVMVDFVQSPKSKVLLKDNVLQVHGIHSKFEKLLTQYLKNLALEKFSYYSHEYAKILGVSFKKISVKEMRTRFGSCTSLGNLNYCWRVVFAPEPVLAYLCAHEISHLKEMNHSKQFWALVALLCPNYKPLEQWLKLYGKDLFNVL